MPGRLYIHTKINNNTNHFCVLFEHLCVDSSRPNEMEDDLNKNKKWKTTSTNKKWKTTSKILLFIIIIYLSVNIKPPRHRFGFSLAWGWQYWRSSQSFKKKQKQNIQQKTNLFQKQAGFRTYIFSINTTT